MSTHTPLPWKIGATVSTNEGIYIEDTQGALIAPCVNRPHQAHDAAFIVQACNSHSKLLEACKAALVNVAPMYSSNHHVVKLLTEALRLAEGRR